MRRSRGRPVCRPVWSLALFSLREICSPAISIIRASPGRSISVSPTPGRPVRAPLKVRYKAQVGKIDKVGSYDPDKDSYKDQPDRARIFVAVVNWKAQHGVTSGMTEPAGMWDPAAKTSLDEGAILGYGDLVITQTATGWVEATLPVQLVCKRCCQSRFGSVLAGDFVRYEHARRLPDGLFDQYDASRRFRVGLLIGNHVPGPKPAGSGTVSR